MTSLTFYANVDGRTIAWSQMDELHNLPMHDPFSRVVAGGVLAGDRDLVAMVCSVLDTSEPNPVTEVTVAHPGVVFEFTEGRDTPADVAAAMVYAGAGRALLGERAREVLNDALPMDDEEDLDLDLLAELIY